MPTFTEVEGLFMVATMFVQTLRTYHLTVARQKWQEWVQSNCPGITMTLQEAKDLDCYYHNKRKFGEFFVYICPAEPECNEGDDRHLYTCIDVGLFTMTMGNLRSCGDCYLETYEQAPQAGATVQDQQEEMQADAVQFQQGEMQSGAAVQDQQGEMQSGAAVQDQQGEMQSGAAVQDQQESPDEMQDAPEVNCVHHSKRAKFSHNRPYWQWD